MNDRNNVVDILEVKGRFFKDSEIMEWGKMNNLTLKQRTQLIKYNKDLKSDFNFDMNFRKKIRSLERKLGPENDDIVRSLKVMLLYIYKNEIYELHVNGLI